MILGSLIPFKVYLRYITLNPKLNPEDSTISGILNSIVCVLPPLSISWIIFILYLCIALNRTPNIDCYWVGAEPKA